MKARTTPRSHRETLEEQKARLQEQQATLAAKLARTASALKAEAKRARVARAKRLGTLVLGTLPEDWEDSTFAGLFTALAALAQTPDPVAVLASLLDDTGRAVEACGAPVASASPTGRLPHGLKDRNGEVALP